MILLYRGSRSAVIGMSFILSPWWPKEGQYMSDMTMTIKVEMVINPPLFALFLCAVK